MPYQSSEKDENDNRTEINTIFWEPDANGYTQFYTNDSRYLGVDGWTFWKWDDSVTQTPMQHVETQVKKISGSSGMGYGVIFCFQDSNNFFMLAIDTHQNYMIGKVVAGALTGIVDWSLSSNLNPGYDIINKVKVQKTGTHTFTFYFNDQQEDTFTDSNTPFFTGGKYGVVVSISPNEDFPDTPVDVRFKQLAP
jgi:hypothetical protein